MDEREEFSQEELTEELIDEVFESISSEGELSDADRLVDIGPDDEPRNVSRVVFDTQDGSYIQYDRHGPIRITRPDTELSTSRAHRAYSERREMENFHLPKIKHEKAIPYGLENPNEGFRTKVIIGGYSYEGFNGEEYEYTVSAVEAKKATRKKIIRLGCDSSEVTVLKYLMNDSTKPFDVVCKKSKDSHIWMVQLDDILFGILQKSLISGKNDKGEMSYEMTVSSEKHGIVSLDVFCEKGYNVIAKEGDNVVIDNGILLFAEGPKGESRGPSPVFKARSVSSPEMDELEAGLGRDAYMDDDGFYRDDQGGYATVQRQYGHSEEEE